jgi:dTDP-4-dehydrorhamnose reductase
MLLFGGSSMSGYSLTQMLGSRCKAFSPPARDRQRDVLNLENPDWIKAQLDRYQPDLILYCHAVCHVRECEDNPDRAWEINVAHLERLLPQLTHTTRLVYVSSDHVFGGNGQYSESSNTCPISAYGRTRVAAEERALSHAGSLVVRHGPIIGPSYNGRSGHLDWLRYRAKNGLPITIIEDEFRSVIFGHDLAHRVMALAQSTVSGIRHLTSTACPSRRELADHLSHGLIPFHCQSRDAVPAPHLGKVELVTEHDDTFSAPLPSPMETPPGLAVNTR